MNWPQYTIELDQGLRQLGQATADAIRLWSARYRVARPRILQFPVNDICNSRCVMCNIWRQKRDREITAPELARVLGAPFFREVRFVGMSGGEPTLRRDLADLGEAICATLPKLQSVHIISNGLRATRVLEGLRGLGEVVRRHGKSYFINISIDGIGAVHDEHRGAPGNFSAATEVIRALRADGFAVGIGCTLTTLNFGYADDVLTWADDEGLRPAYFRLGVDIKRLYNEGFRGSHAFSREQRFHLAMFFEKLSTDLRMDPLRQQMCASLAGQVWDGAARSAGCDWQERGVTLDSRGNLSFCSVQSRIVGSALEGDPGRTLRRGVGERRRILREACSGCEHDLIGPTPPRQVARAGLERIQGPWRRDFAALSRWVRPAPTLRQRWTEPRSPGPSQWHSVVITGWYGTETTGDKAILGALLAFLRRHAPQCRRITLTTLNRRVCEQTLHELGAPEVDLIGLDEAAQSSLGGRTDAVIIGGGPLFPLPQMIPIEVLFAQAARRRAARILFGCGVGPLEGGGDLVPVMRVVQLASGGFFRDEQSRALAVRFGADPALGVGFDPSIGFLRDWVVQAREPARDAKVRCVAVLARDNTWEYVHGDAARGLEARNQTVATNIARALADVADPGALDAALLPMHCLPVGGDDRLFNRRIEKAGATPCRLGVRRDYVPLPEMLAEIHASCATIAMRYHGHLFSIGLARPFVSIDYSGPRGKVGNLLTRLGWNEFGLGWSSFEAGDLGRLLRRVLEERPELENRLARARAGFVESYDQAAAALARA